MFIPSFMKICLLVQNWHWETQSHKNTAVIKMCILFLGKIIFNRKILKIWWCNTNRMEGCGVCLLYLRMEASGRICEYDSVSLASVGTWTLFIIYQGWFSSLKFICWVIFCQILSFSATELSSQKCFCHNLLSGTDISHCSHTIHADSCFSNNPVWYNSFYIYIYIYIYIYK